MTLVVSQHHASVPSTTGAALTDGHGRRIHHLRLSVISACNLHCIYCMPNAARVGSRQLTDRNRAEFVRHLHDRYALSQVRITGGEPLLYPRLRDLIESLRAISPHLALAMTTNAQGLADRASSLREVGLDRLNISLDTLDPDRYRAMTGGELLPVLDGIDSAIAAGFPPPKLNSVVLRGENDDEVAPLAEWALERGCEMRFLEAMPIGPAADVNRRLFVPADEILARLENTLELKPLGIEFGGTSLRFRCVGRACSGIIGVVAPITKPFCGSCGRVRLTADGQFYPCLLDERCADLRATWTRDGFDAELADRLIRTAVHEKRSQGPARQSTAMVALGG